MKKQLLCIKPESNDIAWTFHTQICFGDRIYVTLADEDASTKCCCLSVICQPDNSLTTKFSTLDPFCQKHFLLFFGIFESLHLAAPVANGAPHANDGQTTPQSPNRT